MDKDYQAPPNFLGESSAGDNSNNNSTGMVDYMLHGTYQPQPQQQQFAAAPFGSSSSSFDKLCFADVMQFAEFGPKLALNQTTIQEDQETGIDPVYFLKFPVLNDKLEDRPHLHHHQPSGDHGYQGINRGVAFLEEKTDLEARVSGEDENNNVNSVQLQFLGEDDHHTDQNNKINNNPNTSDQVMKNNKRKRPRTMKTNEEVESQRMTHIAVERNRRKQMNEHLRVLRSLMPGSYVQRGDQASIIGGAIEFVRELEQLLQCLESQKRRRILGETAQRQIGADATSSLIAGAPPSIIPGAGVPSLDQQMKLGNVVNEFDSGGLREETAENKSCLADVEVKLLGFDAMIKILSRRRPGQLIKTIAALEDLQLCILHTNITTIEQTVLYSFNVKVTSETRFTAEDIASSIQQIFSFIHASTTM